MTKRYAASDFVRARDWVPEKGGDTFPTQSSFEWFVRQHRAELMASGEVIVRRGTGGTLVGPGFGELAIAIMQRKQSGAA
jgi:hypothetical protein